MLAPCAVHVPLGRIPATVVVARAGRRLPPSRDPFLERGDRVEVRARARLRLNIGGTRYWIGRGTARLVCRRSPTSAAPTLAPELVSGTIAARAGRAALVITPESMTAAPGRGTPFTVTRTGQTTRSRTRGRLIVVALARDPAIRLNARVTYTAIADRRGLRLDVWPFALNARERPATATDALPAYWADGLPCSIGCTAPAVPGWPLKPFHAQHAIRAGINELRPANFHVGVDIEARDGQAVYAIQSGTAHIRYPRSPDVNVDIGRFGYWHIRPSVIDGQHVVAYRTVLGHVLHGFRHLALSERTPRGYLNPLRPGGSVKPFHDHERPVIGMPRLFADGSATVAAFDPQSFIAHGPYETPVLAPSSLAWRLYDRRNRPLTPLMWAMRGSQNLPAKLKPLVFAPGASNPGFACFYRRRLCIPNWTYRLAGGLTPPLPLARLRPGRYRLTVYAWDWAGNTAALDDPITLPLRAAAARAAEFGPLNARPD